MGMRELYTYIKRLLLVLTVFYCMQANVANSDLQHAGEFRHCEHAGDNQRP